MSKDYSITIFYCAKSFVLLVATIYASATGLDSGTLATVGALSLAAIPLFAFLESR